MISDMVESNSDQQNIIQQATQDSSEKLSTPTEQQQQQQESSLSAENHNLNTATRSQQQNDEISNHPNNIENCIDESNNLSREDSENSAQSSATTASEANYIDGVFSNMKVTNNHPNDQNKIKIKTFNPNNTIETTKGKNQTSSSSLEDLLPKYEEIAHLTPPKYSDLFRSGSSADSTNSSHLDYNELEFNGMSIGGYDIFFGFCFLTMFFNLVGFILSILITDSYAGKYGACFGLGILIAISGIFNIPFSLNPSPVDSNGNPSDNKENFLLARSLSLSFFFLGSFICILCIMFYHRVRSESSRYNEVATV